MIERKRVTLNVRMPPVGKAKLEAAAAIREVSVSEFVRQSLEEATRDVLAQDLGSLAQPAN